jgi:antitoxin (DNA-binding transcriptional repressor) of toxin-antitoxin stability system
MRYSIGMTAVTLEEIQRDLKGYLERVHAGETLIVLQADQPLAEIKPVVPETPIPRPFGLCAGEFTVPEDFDEPLPEDIVSSFEGR